MEPYEIFEQIDFLIQDEISEQIESLMQDGLFEDAYDLLRKHPDKNSVDYLFNLAYLEAIMGQKMESIQTLRKLYEEHELPDELRSIFYGFSADIMHDEGWKKDAVEEIYKAYELNPDDSFIKEKMEEFINDFGGDLNNLLFLFEIYKNITSKK